MKVLGMTALHLRIADFKFTHNFIICNRLPDMDIIFGIGVQKKFSIAYAWDREKNCYMQRDGKFLTYTLETVNRRPQLALSSHHLKYLQDTMVSYQLKSQDKQLRNIWLISSLMKIQQKERTPI